jgi:hypothetical protein
LDTKVKPVDSQKENALEHSRRLAVLIILSGLSTAAAQTNIPLTEKIEWTWSDRPENPVAGLPNVLLVGDSITRGYYAAAANDLKDVANVYLFASSTCSGDRREPGELRGYFSMIGVQFAVIHFNNGMHGWGYTEGQYAAGLSDMVGALRGAAPEAKLIWANTTPVLHDSASGATNARIDERNRLAAEWMVRSGILMDDQHSLMLKHEDLYDGDIHFTKEGSTIQAEQVAAMIRSTLVRR